MDDYAVSKEQIDAAVKHARVYINRLIGAISVLERIMPDSAENGVVSSLVFNASGLLAQNINLAYVCEENPYRENPRVVNSSALIAGITGECEKILEPAGRRLVIRNNSGGGIKIDEKAFTVVFMNLLQNALFYSPKDSAVFVSSENSGNYAVITIENAVSRDFEKSGALFERSGLGLAMSRKTAEWHNAVFEFHKDDNAAVVRLSFPLVREKPEFGLATDYTEYISERFNPVRLFLNEVVREE
ncbi:MAG: hypothetical protein LBI38_07680 [Oscillospiraceae bacterium]|jgi:signal transduction histidine kinase|nr:hypothetical protein [Oscillospiraceae bacterium]